MIIDEEFERLTDNPNEKDVKKFIRSHLNDLVHFYMIYDSDVAVTEIKTFEADELIIPTRSSDLGELMVIYTNKDIAVSLIEGGVRIGSVKLSKALSIASTKKNIDGVFFQGRDSGFTAPNCVLNLEQNA